jgi:thioredoxin reductase (NADPH)
MTKFASSVTIVHRRGEFTASKIMQEKVKGNKKIKVIFNHTVEEVLGDGKKVSGALLRNVLDNSKKEIKCEGIFLAIGHTPNTDFCKNAVKVNEQGYIITDRMMHTSVGGVFAAGDVQDMRFRQAITAAGSGCMAAMEAEKWLRG